MHESDGFSASAPFGIAHWIEVKACIGPSLPRTVHVLKYEHFLKYEQKE